MAIRRLLANNPHLQGEYDEDTCNVRGPHTLPFPVATASADHNAEHSIPTSQDPPVCIYILTSRILKCAKPREYRLSHNISVSWTTPVS